MLWPKVLNKGTALGSRRIAQLEDRCKFIIDHDDAFEAASCWRKILCGGDLLRKQLASAGDLNLTTRDRSSQSLTRRLAHTGCLLEMKPFGSRRREDGAR